MANSTLPQENVKKQLNRKKTGIFKNCENCGRFFYVPHSKSHIRFCSKECTKRREVVKCECGKEFESHISSHRRFCSPECSNRFSAGREAHPNVIARTKERSRARKLENDKKGLDRLSLIDSIIKKRVSPPDLAREVGVSHCTILNRMREYGVTVDNYPELVAIRREHKAKGNKNRSEETKKNVSLKVSAQSKSRWEDADFKSSMSKKLSVAMDSKVEVVCSYCGAEKKVPQCITKKNKEFFCGKECRAKFLSDGNAWNSLNGGVSYAAYAPQISFAEDVRGAESDSRVLEAKCAYCGAWFKPSPDQASRRAKALYAKKGVAGEARFYCSDGCKESCPIYKQVKYPKGFRKATSREVVPELRQIVFERDGWKCQKCGATDTLHCHHIKGYTQEKMFANDPDNCITLCKKCHKEIHKTPGCGYHDLKCKDK